VSETDYIARYLDESAATMQAFAASAAAVMMLARMGEVVSHALRAGGKLLIAGNGGSAADAQHIAGEFTSRLMFDRRPLAALALTTDTSGMTAIANDYGYEHVFSRQVIALGRPGDVFLGLSTSGRSPNVLRALEAARDAGLVCLGFAGKDGGPMRERCDLLLEAPSSWTPLIQQVHVTAAHVVCALAERALCPVPAR
jgi:D-sedoheptulose 7-phosphate isomerase